MTPQRSPAACSPQTPMEACRHRDRGAHDVTQARSETLLARMLPPSENGREA
jgi:hypothetical protein